MKILVLLYPYICCALFLLYIEHFELFSKNHFGLEFDKGRACQFIIPHRNTKEALSFLTIQMQPYTFVTSSNESSAAVLQSCTEESIFSSVIYYIENLC